MEPYHQSQSLPDSHQARSRASSQVSVHESRYASLNIVEHPIEPLNSRDTPASESLPSLSTNPSTEAGGSPAFLTCPTPNSFTSYPHPSHSNLNQEWSYLEPSDPSATPLVRIEQPQEQILTKTHSLQTSEPESYDQATMSTLGIHFDSRFDAGNRSSYSWPVFDINEPYVNHNLGGLDPFNGGSAEASYARSLSSSPPQAIFSPEQRELKRQRDQARRNSKKVIRRERSASNSYNVSQATTPDMIPRSMNDFSTSSMIQSSIPAEAMLPMTSQPYMANCGTPMSSSESPELYGAPFPMISNDYNVNGYLMPFSSATTDSCIPSYAPRPHSLSSASDQPYFYRSPPLMTQESPDTVRVVHSRPKPQCWDHGCNGRQFSTFSNLLRHQREKSGVASKPTCPKCGAEFTRTTARNGHMAHEKCKQRRNS